MFISYAIQLKCSFQSSKSLSVLGSNFHDGRKYRIKRGLNFGKQVRVVRRFKGFTVLTVTMGKVYGEYRYEWRIAPCSDSTKQLISRRNKSRWAELGWQLCPNKVEFDPAASKSVRGKFSDAVSYIRRMLLPTLTYGDLKLDCLGS